MPLFKETYTCVNFDFLHGHIQHVTVLDEKTPFRPFKRVTGCKNMVKYVEMSCFIKPCTPLYRKML